MRLSILGTERTRTIASAAAVGLAAGVLYFLTAARDIVVGDSPELITAAATLGVAHPPGYPLFTIIGHIFSMLPVGSIPFRLNLFAAICDALAVAVVFLTAERLTRSRLAALVAALVLAANATFWAWSLVAEVFALNNLLASALIYLLVRWHERPDRSGFLIAAAFATGLGLTNHQTIALLMPAVAYLLWQNGEHWWESPRVISLALLAFAAGLLPYLYVPWASARHPECNWGNVSSFHDLLALIARKSYGSGRLVSVAEYAGGSFLSRIAALFVSMGLLGGGLAVIGLFHSYRNRRWYFWFALIAFLFAGLFFVSITNLNLATAPSALFVLQRFFLLSHVILAPLYAFGVLAIVDLIALRESPFRRQGLRLVAIAVLAGVLATVFLNYRRIDQSRNFIARKFAEDLFGTVEPGAILLATGDGIAFPLMYRQVVEKAHRDITLILLPTLAAHWYVQKLRAQHPDLQIPFESYDAQNNNLKLFVEANRDRTICIAGTIGNNDQSLNADYWPYQHGLALVVEPKSKVFTIQQMVDDNENLFARYRPPLPATVRRNSFEADILNLYTWPVFRIANDYERVGGPSEARQWYQRALKLDPDFKQAREALARLQH